MMTEDDAKTKWCFAAVASHTDPRAGFHPSDPEWPSQPQKPTFACIGSACMAWRWDSLPIAFDGDTATYGGYCGLAGRPDDRKGNGGKP